MLALARVGGRERRLSKVQLGFQTATCSAKGHVTIMSCCCFPLSQFFASHPDRGTSTVPLTLTTPSPPAIFVGFKFFTTLFINVCPLNPATPHHSCQRNCFDYLSAASSGRKYAASKRPEKSELRFPSTAALPSVCHTTLCLLPCPPFLTRSPLRRSCGAGAAR